MTKATKTKANVKKIVKSVKAKAPKKGSVDVNQTGSSVLNTDMSKASKLWNTWQARAKKDHSTFIADISPNGIFYELGKLQERAKFLAHSEGYKNIPSKIKEMLFLDKFPKQRVSECVRLLAEHNEVMDFARANPQFTSLTNLFAEMNKANKVNEDTEAEDTEDTETEETEAKEKKASLPMSEIEIAKMVAVHCHAKGLDIEKVISALTSAKRTLDMVNAKNKKVA
tara:strand:- start:1746 stop:2423 length:678 start_codon:yes stop_codon:yes gene_type:complete